MNFSMIGGVKEFDPNKGRTTSRWQQLHDVGVTVVPVLSPTDRISVLAEVLKSVRNSPELKEPVVPNTNTPLLVTLGGFGALGTPSSYHFTIIRKIRGEILRVVGQELFAAQPRNVEVLADRLCLRLKGQSPGEELWHRDISPADNPEDDIMGGWLNLSNYNQYLSCVLNTQNEHENHSLAVGDHIKYYTLESVPRKKTKEKVYHKGVIKAIRSKSLVVSTKNEDVVVSLAKVVDEYAEEVTADTGFFRINKRRIPELEQQKIKVLVPPGCYVSFNQLMIHEVLGTPAEGNENEPYCKLFTGFRLSEDRTPLFQGLRRIFMEQGLPPLGSGQIVPQYSKNHYAFHERGFEGAPGLPKFKNGIQDWSTRFRDEIPRERSKKIDRTYVVREFPSLTFLQEENEKLHRTKGVPRHQFLLPAYTEGELEVATGGARRQWSSVWGLYEGEWRHRPFSLDAMPALLDLDGPGPSDLSAYAPDRLTGNRARPSMPVLLDLDDFGPVDLTAPAPEDRLTDEDMQHIYTNAAGELVYDPDRDSDDDWPRPRPRASRRVLSSSESSSDSSSEMPIPRPRASRRVLSSSDSSSERPKSKKRRRVRSSESSKTPRKRSSKGGTRKK